MLPVCIAPLRENTCPKINSQSAGWRARVMSSVKSWRSLRNSNSVMTNVFSKKPVKGWMKAAVIGLGLAKALGRSACGGYVAEGAAGIKGASGIVDEDLIQRVAAAKRGLEFLACAKRSHLAQVHDRDAITMALRLLQVMGGEEQGRAVVGPQIDEMFPNSVARNRVQPDGRLIEEEHPRPMQRGLGDFQAADHAPRVLPHQAAAVGSQAHELQCLADARLLLAMWQVVEFGEDEQVLVAGERTVHGDRLRHVTDDAANLDRLGVDREPSHPRPARGGRQQRSEHFDRGGLASPVGAEQAEPLADVYRKGYSIDRRKCAEATRERLDLQDDVAHIRKPTRFGRANRHGAPLRPLAWINSPAPTVMNWLSGS